MAEMASIGKRWACAGVMALIAGAGLAITDAPEPRPGNWGDATLALLRHNRALCDRVAGDVLSYWRELPADHDAQLERNERAVRDHILRQLLAELASAQAAGDLARRFLPGALREVGAESGASLARIADLQKTFCEAVAYPAGPRHRFADQIAESLARIDAEEAELGRLLVVPDEDLTMALEPYRPTIELAGVEAQGEYLTYLESLKPKPEAPSLEYRMTSWHDRYRVATQPSKEALGRFLQARRAGDRNALGEACRELSRATIDLLAQGDAIFQAPAPAVGATLRGAFRSLKSMAAACTLGDFARVDERLAVAEQRLGIAAAHLRPFGLAP